MLELKITGDEEIKQTIAKASQKMQKEATFAALVVALQPLVARIQANAPKNTGALKRSIGFRIRRYRGGKTLYGSVGPRHGVYGPHNNKPSKYVHLVEFGHWAGKGANRRFVSANGFLRRSWIEKRDTVLKIFNQQFGTRLVAEIESRRRQTKRI